MGMFTILGVIEYLKCVFILKFIFVENAVIIKRFLWVSEEDFGLWTVLEELITGGNFEVELNAHETLRARCRHCALNVKYP